MTNLILRNALLTHGGHADLSLADGKITRIAPVGTLEADGADVEELDGALLLPGLVEGHIHLDKTLLGLPWLPHLDGDSVAERVDAEKRLRRTLDVPLAERARRGWSTCRGLGQHQLRCHVDVDDEVGLTGLEALLALRERYGPRRDPARGVPAERHPAPTRRRRAARRCDRRGVELVGGLDPAGMTTTSKDISM